MHCALLLTALLLALPPPAVAQSDEENARAQLHELQRTIATINRQLSSARARRSALEQQLQEAETLLGRLQNDMAITGTAIESSRSELAAMQLRQSELQTSLAGQQQRVISEMRGAWQMGNEAQLKVLLSQQNPHTVSRMMAYYRYFFEARSELLLSYRQTLQQLQVNEQNIADTNRQLLQTRAELERQQQQLAGAQAARQEAVASLSADISAKGGQLQQLQQDREKLEQLLQAIEEAVVNLQVPEDFQDFAAAKGKMPWPIAGKASNRYGRARNDGKMRWQGLMIPAPEGTTVKAIHHGRVVYADWFRGSGLLLIIDHSDGYMSLYAHNQSLLLDVGEWVTAGTPIGSVGSSGGRERPALYFEIRHQGKPTNPGPWCSG